jgi:cell division septum initiation protein DivIVA
MADILYLVERLEQVLAQGWRVPFTTNAVIDEDAFIDIVEQMHIAIPTEIRQAQQIVQQKERILAQAREEAERMVAQSHEQIERQVDEMELVARARSRAEQIIAEAKDEAEDIRAGADNYAYQVLNRIRNELHSYMRQVENGIERLQPAPEPEPVQTIQLEESEDGYVEEDEEDAQTGNVESVRRASG